MASAVSSLRPTTSSETGTARFNAEAAAWDSNPFVHQASHEAAKALLECIPRLRDGSKSLDVLEIGCGTGLLTFLVAPHARQVVAVDAAEGMIEVLKTKLKTTGTPRNVVPVAVLLEDPEDEALPQSADGNGRMKFDLIVSHLVLHHIPNLEGVLRTMYGCLRPGGEVALTDFEDFGSQAKRFHPQSKMEGVQRHGIERGWIEGLLRGVGFREVSVRRTWSMEKRVERFEGEFGAKGKAGNGGGEMVRFPFVVCRGKKDVGEMMLVEGS